MNNYAITYNWLSDPEIVVTTVIEAESKGDAKRRFIMQYSHVNGGIIEVKKHDTRI